MPTRAKTGASFTKIVHLLVLFSGDFQKSRDSAAVFLKKKMASLRKLESIFSARFSLVELCERIGPTLLNWKSLNRFL
jgi:hypothetical protein